MKHLFGLTTCLAMFVGVEANAVVVHFGDFTSGPSDTLHFGGVTVSAWTGWGDAQPPAGLPATVLGAGLGADLIGPSDTIDRELFFQAGAPFATEVDEDLNISVDGTINSLTIVPYFSILEPGGPVTFPFDIHFQPKSGEPPVWMVVDPSDPSPVKITFPMQGESPGDLDFIGLDHDSFPGTDGYLYNYFSASGYASMTVRMGFTITELDYTPVPEPSTLLFLGSGLVPLGAVARRRTHRSELRHEKLIRAIDKA